MADNDKTQDAPAAKPELGEIASSRDGRDITIGFFGTLRQNTDPILAGRGGDIRLYEELLRDDQVQSCFQQRKRAIVSAEWGVVAGGKDKADQMAAGFIKEQLDNIDFDGATEKMAQGLFNGYAVGECLYARDGRYWTLDAVKVRRAARFRFGVDGSLRLLTQSNSQDGELMPPRKFWTYAAGADNDDDPYGRGLGHYCYWPVWFKKNAIKFWATYLDKYGAPTAVGKYPQQASKEDQDKLLGAVAAMRSDSGMIIPEGMLIELVEATRAGSVDFDKLYDRMDGAIAKVILSQTMTTDAKASGIGSGAAEAHMEVREEIVKSDADIICGGFNRGPVRWQTEWNFPGARLPVVYRKLEQQEDLSSAAERDVKLTQIGWAPSEQRIKEVYGENYERVQRAVLPGLPGNPTPPAPAGPSFAETPPDAVDDLVAQLEEIAAPMQTEIVGSIRKLLYDSASFAEFQTGLRKLNPNVDGFASLMREGIALSNLTGRDDLEEDR
ncbi:MAG: DUF935 family protein [Parvibaculum sp.]|uniref:DUF935 domain-containing protein n=1 Tax=Parvibaculum sp. TaxID=2024848 RepID=UPI0027178A4E|nr:DUF935 family protein [Parvibaculum sp.]MDO8838009.1 DUF935 family protein [Parvibaculum sp.]